VTRPVGSSVAAGTRTTGGARSCCGRLALASVEAKADNTENRAIRWTSRFTVSPWGEARKSSMSALGGKQTLRLAGGWVLVSHNPEVEAQRPNLR